MDFIVKDEPAGWAISVWVIDKHPTGIRLMVPDEVVHGEIVWRWDPLVEGQELPTPTFRFNWDFIEEFTCAIQKRLPKRVDDEVLKTLNIERQRVDQFIGYLTHKLTHKNIEKTSEVYSQVDVDYIKQQNETLQKQVQMLQAELLKAKKIPTGATMHHADKIIEEVYGPQEIFAPPSKEELEFAQKKYSNKSNKSAFQAAVEKEMAQFPASPPKLIVGSEVKEELFKLIEDKGFVVPE